MAKIVLETQEINAGWTFERLELTPERLSILVTDDLGRRKRIDYMGADAEAFVGMLNVSDFSPPNPTMVEAMLQRLIDDGHFTGTVE